MECPSCLSRLVRENTPYGYMWVCRSCGGRSATMPVLRRAGVRHEFLREIWQKVRSSPAGGFRACPHCGRTMPQVRMEMLSDNLLLDICPTCPAIWFDPAEFDSVPRLPPKPVTVTDGVDAETRQALAVLEVKRMARQAEAPADAERFGPDETWQWLPALLGFPVELNAPQVVARPWITWGLIAACCLLFGMTMGDAADHEALVRNLGFVPTHWERLGFLTFVTSFFVHANIFHLLGNMWALWTFGDNTEDRLGPSWYAAMLLGGHVAGVLLQSAFDPRHDIPVIGASDGITAVIAFYAITFPKVRIGILVWWRWFRLPVLWCLAFYALLQLVGTTMQVRGFGSVSHLGHVGGLAVGAFAAWLFRVNHRMPAPR